MRPVEDCAHLAVSDKRGRERLTARLRRFNVYINTSITSPPMNSFGRENIPAWRYEFSGCPPRWSLRPCFHEFRAADAAAVKTNKILGLRAAHDNVYPDNPQNERWPYFRPARPMLAVLDLAQPLVGAGSKTRQLVLASRPDTMARACGLGSRAFDLPEPPPGPTLPSPVLPDAASVDAWLRGAPRDVYSALLLRVDLQHPVGYTVFASAAGWLLLRADGGRPHLNPKHLFRPLDQFC